MESSRVVAAKCNHSSSNLCFGFRRHLNYVAKVLAIVTASLTFLGLCTLQVSAASDNKLQNGILLSYDNFLEVLDPSTGVVIAHASCANLSLISRLAVRKVAPDRIQVLAADLLADENSNLHLVAFNFVNNSSSNNNRQTDLAANNTFLKGVGQLDDLTLDASSDRAYLLSEWQVKGYSVAESQQPNQSLAALHNFALGIAVDSCESDVYWSEQNGGRGSVIKRHDGTSISTVESSDSDRRKNLVIKDRYLYWTSKRRGHTVIERMSLAAASNPSPRVEEVCRVSGTFIVYSMTIDDANAIYWSDTHNYAVWKITVPSDVTSHDDVIECHPHLLKDMRSVRPMSIVSLSSGKQSCKSPTPPQVKVAIKTSPVTPDVATSSSFSRDEATDVATGSDAAMPIGVTTPSNEPLDCSEFCDEHKIEYSDFVEGDVSSGQSIRWKSKCFHNPVRTGWQQVECQCQSGGFKGARCQLDPCHNLCLNGGKCKRRIDPEDDPVCHCAEGFAGGRCQEAVTAVESEAAAVAKAAAKAAAESDDDDDESTNFYLLMTAAFALVILTLIMVIMAFDNYRLRRQIKAGANGYVGVSSKGHHHQEEASMRKSSPEIVRKNRGRTRVFSAGRKSGGGNGGGDSSCSRSRSCGGRKGGEDNPAAEVTSQQQPSVGVLNQVSFCNGGGKSSVTSKDGVVLDLEDCCQMTLCDNPCVEASFRRPTQRKSRLISVSKIEDGDDIEEDDTQRLIY